MGLSILSKPTSMLLSEKKNRLHGQGLWLS
jgi:hypothetical protein